MDIGGATVPPSTGDSPAAQIERLRRRFRVLRSVVEASRDLDNIDETIAGFLEKVCTGFGWPAGLYFVAEGDGVKSFVPTEVRWPPGPQNQLRTLHERVLEEAGNSLHAQVLSYLQPRWIPNVTLDPGFSATKQAVALGVRGVVALPVMCGERLQGLVEFYTREEFNPSNDQVEYLGNLAIILGTVLRLRELRQQAKKVRREQEQIFHQMQDCIYIVDVNGKVTFANTSAGDFFGVSPADLVGQVVHDVYHGGSAAAGIAAKDCPVHGLPARTLGTVQRRERFRMGGKNEVEVDAVAAPFGGDGVNETIVVLRRARIDGGR